MNMKWTKLVLTLFLAMAGLSLAARVVFFSNTPVVKAATTGNWLQFAFDEEKSGFNPNETTLSTSNVGGLKQIFSITASGKVDGTPVLLTGVSTASGTRDLLFFSTFGGELYAVDAHTGTQIWTQTVTCSGCQSNSSPAIDPNGQYVYFLGLDGNVHKYQVGNGTEIKTGGWPADVLGSNSTKSHAALGFATAANGNTYLYASGGSFDINPQGHVTAINLATGTANTFNFTCSNVAGLIGTGGFTCGDSGAGIWSRGGFAYHPGTNLLYTETAEWGTFAPPTRWSQSAMAIPADGSHTGAPADGSVVDSYTPTNWAAEIAADHDLGSTQPNAMPDLPGTAGGKHYVMVNAKDSILRILDASNMSGQGGPGNVGGGAFTVPITGIGEIFSSCAVWTDPSDGSVYIIVPGTTGYAGFTYTLGTNGIPMATEVWSHATNFVSSAVVANGVAYLATGGGLSPSSTNNFLMAVDIKTGATLWSGPAGSGSLHWSSPIVANGMVYMSNAASPSTITAYGLGTVTPPPAAPTSLTATALSSSQINLSWTASTTTGVTYTVMRNGTVDSSGIAGTTFSDTGLQASTTYSYTVEAVDSAGTSSPSNQASATTLACATDCVPSVSIAINAGGPAEGSFVADEDFTGGSTIDHANAINTSNVTDPAPAAVYQTARDAATTASGVGATFSYTIPGLTAGASYLVRLHFAETFFTTAGSRVFNVGINGTQVLTDFDIIKAAGGENIANIQQFTTTANTNGQIAIMFTSVTNNALISGIEIDSTTSTPPPPPPPQSCTTLCIDSGSTTAVSPFVADADFTGGSTINHANTINTSNVTNPAPAAVYQTARDGATQASGVGAPFTYTIPGLAAYSSHTVRLHFAETFFTTKGSRVFNVSINGTQVLTNFDIVAASGGENIANIQQFPVTVPTSGQIVITFTSVTNNALISGIEID
jgi:outer membrane protein assembly factor BamB